MKWCVNCDQGPVFEFLLEIRNKHCQYYWSKKNQTCLSQGCWAPRGHNGLQLRSTCVSIRVSNKTWEDGKMARWQGGKVARWLDAEGLKLIGWCQICSKFLLDGEQWLRFCGYVVSCNYTLFGLAMRNPYVRFVRMGFSWQAQMVVF